MSMADQNSSGEGRRVKVWVCPECGEPMRPGSGHYHDNPDERFAWRIFHPAEEIEVAPVSELERVEAERERAESGHEFTKQWYAERIRKITDVAKREGIWEEVACILANGTSGPEEPPTYAQLLNMAKWGHRQSETRASALVGEQRRLTSLQAGLRAEVERLRKEIESADTMRTFCLREEERDLTAKYQGMEEAGRDCADRLENLLRESEGEA